MRLEQVVYCSGPECDTHQRVGPSTASAGRLPVGWVEMRTYGGNGNVHVEAFCHTDCCMKWCAGQHPLESVG